MDEKTQKKLLGSLYKDVEFLNHMVKDESKFFYERNIVLC